ENSILLARDRRAGSGRPERARGGRPAHRVGQSAISAGGYGAPLVCVDRRNSAASTAHTDDDRSTTGRPFGGTAGGCPRRQRQNGKSRGATSSVARRTSAWTSSPTRAKSRAVYSPGPMTSRFTGVATGVENAVDAAIATVIITG